MCLYVRLSVCGSNANSLFVFYVTERRDIMGSNCLKGVSGQVIVDEKGIKNSWKEYMKKPINEENEWDHRISAGVKEGPADCIRIDEVAAVLKKMKRHKAPGLSGLVHTQYVCVVV